MATKVELPREIIAKALRAAMATNNRNKNASENKIIKDALDEENRHIALAINGMTEVK